MQKDFTFHKLQRDSWHLLVPSGTVLEPWFDRLDDPELGFIKNLPHRKVFRAEDRLGNSYHIKHSISHSFLSSLTQCIRRPLYHEFLTLLKLQQARIPCIRPVGYGYSSSHELLITETAPDCMTALEFWHTLGHDPKTAEEFLESLTALLKKLKQNQFIHKDFHAENILCQSSTHKLFLVDPYKLSKCHFWEKGLRDILFCDALLFLSNRLSDTRIIRMLQDASLVPDAAAGQKLLQNTRLRKQNIDLHKYEKRIARLLNGTSQYSRIEPSENGRLHIRNTPWNTRREFCREQSEAVFMPHDEARALWISTILPPHEVSSDKEILAWQETAISQSDDIIFYAKENP